MSERSQASDPGSHEEEQAAHSEAVRHLLNAGRPDLAEERLRRALRSEPEDCEALFLLAWGLYRQERAEESESACRAALRPSSAASRGAIPA